jgi:chaperonin cofactor prefoldin
MENLTSEELTNLQKVVQQFSQAKMQLGETVIAQENLLASVKEIKLAYSEIEKSLMETYGADALINIETGEISKEEKKEE